MGAATKKNRKPSWKESEQIIKPEEPMSLREFIESYVTGNANCHGRIRFSQAYRNSYYGLTAIPGTNFSMRYAHGAITYRSRNVLPDAMDRPVTEARFFGTGNARDWDIWLLADVPKIKKIRHREGLPPIRPFRPDMGAYRMWSDPYPPPCNDYDELPF